MFFSKAITHRLEIDYDPAGLPDVGDYMVDALGDPHQIVKVNRAEGWFEVQGGARTNMPKIARM